MLYRHPKNIADFFDDNQNVLATVQDHLAKFSKYNFGCIFKITCQCSHFVQPVVQPYGRVRKVAKKYVSHVEITKNGGAVEIIKYKKFLSFLIIQKQENKRHQLVVGQALEMVATPEVTPA